MGRDGLIILGYYGYITKQQVVNHIGQIIKQYTDAGRLQYTGLKQEKNE